MPTVLPAKAPFGSTQRPVQEILLIAPLSVALARRASTSIAWGVLNAACLRSGESSSMPFILNSGQYSQSKFRVRKPVFSPLAIFSAKPSISSKLRGGPARPASLNIVLL